MIRVVIADDHPVVRTGLRQIATLGAEIEVIGEAGTGDEVLALLARNGADVLLLDVSMPGPGVFRLVKALLESHPRLRILVLSMHPEDQYAARLLQAGAAGYLTKDRSPEDLVEAIRRVHAGRRYISLQFAEELAGRLAGPPADAPHETLSNREFEVLCRLGGGLTVKEVAEALGLSCKTVSTYRTRLREKMNFHTNADLVRYVHGRGLSVWEGHAPSRV